MAVELANLIENSKCNLQQLLSANLALIPKGGKLQILGSGDWALN